MDRVEVGEAAGLQELGVARPETRMDGSQLRAAAIAAADTRAIVDIVARRMRLAILSRAEMMPRVDHSSTCGHPRVPPQALTGIEQDQRRE
jgi:hypothetical protein